MGLKIRHLSTRTGERPRYLGLNSRVWQSNATILAALKSAFPANGVRDGLGKGNTGGRYFPARPGPGESAGGVTLPGRPAKPMLATAGDVKGKPLKGS